MKVALCQQDIVWGDPEGNRRKLDAMIEEASGCELALLPEMFSTGFATEDPQYAESCTGGSLEWMKRKSAEKNMAIAGSLAVKVGDKYYNRHFFVTPEGGEEHYDKKHLFTTGGENRTFSSGNERRIVCWRGVRFLLTVCYDLRFPVWLRNRDDYDVILCPANWPIPRIRAWEVLSVARAIENQSFVLACNRVGRDPVCEYDGSSVIVNPYGDVIGDAPKGKECVITADLDLEALKRFRSKLPVSVEADRFELI